MMLVTLSPAALISRYKLTTSGGKHLEKISLAHIVSSMNELKSSAKDTDGLSVVRV